MLQFRKLVGDITYIHTREGFVYLAGRDGAAYSKRIVGYAMTGTHANRPASKTLCKIGGSGSPAHRGCDDFSCRVRGSQHTSADYTATMNKYGIHRIGGKNRRVPRTAPQQISFNATRAGKKLVNQQDIPHQKKSNQRGGIMD